MISRQWCGIARPDQAEAYLKHLRAETFPQLRAIAGFLGAAVYRREVSKAGLPGVEFLVETRWASMEAIRRFAGTDPERAVVPEKAQAMMMEFDRVVRHYEVLA
jgi:heme-degrading monooxygenase HmoA